MQAWSLLGAGVQVKVRHGRLVLRTLSPIPVLYRGLVLHPDDDTDPDIFRVDLSRYGMAPARVVFSRNSAGGVTGVHLDGLPLSAEKRSAPETPSPAQVGSSGTPGAVAVGIGLRQKGADE
jgi:hypothetical protein